VATAETVCEPALKYDAAYVGEAIRPTPQPQRPSNGERSRLKTSVSPKRLPKTSLKLVSS